MDTGQVWPTVIFLPWTFTRKSLRPSMTVFPKVYVSNHSRVIFFKQKHVEVLVLNTYFCLSWPMASQGSWAGLNSPDLIHYYSRVTFFICWNYLWQILSRKFDTFGFEPRTFTWRPLVWAQNGLSRSMAWSDWSTTVTFVSLFFLRKILRPFWTF